MTVAIMTACAMHAGDSAAKADGMSTLTASTVGYAGPAQWQLESVVIVSRHGVRSPTRPKPPLASLSPDAWPRWSVPAGDLTDRGATLVGQMGSYYGAWLRAQKVLPEQGCPKPGEVYAWADVNQRTRLTGNALVQNIAPGCKLSAAHQTELDQDDPIFQATKSGACKLDPLKARQAIEARLGETGFDGLNRRYGKSLARMGDILHFSQSPYCREHGSDKSCRLEALGNDVKFDAGGRKASLSGPLSIASTVSEVFLLEYAQGLPQSDVAWGRITNAADWRSLLEAHNAQFDLMAKTPYLASHAGTPMMMQIVDVLESRAGGKPQAILHAPPGNRVYILAGHDTNVANIAGMLNLQWTLPDQPDNTPPGGALVFSLWRDPASSQRYVSVELAYQSLDQLRQATPLSMATPPKRLALAIPGCADPAHGGACRLDDFMRVARQSLASDCSAAGH